MSLDDVKIETPKRLYLKAIRELKKHKLKTDSPRTSKKALNVMRKYFIVELWNFCTCLFNQSIYSNT